MKVRGFFGAISEAGYEATTTGAWIRLRPIILFIGRTCTDK